MAAATTSTQSTQPTQTPGRHVAIWGILAISAVLRMLAIGRPLVGNFATKNVVYAMIARNWAEGRASLWYPTLDCLAAGQRSWHMLEFPFSAYLIGWFWKSLGGSLDAWGRATAAVFSVAAVAVLYGFVSRRHGRVAGGGAALALGLAPVSVIYGQSFMLESSLLFFTVAAFASLDHWLRGRKLAWLAISGICLAFSLLTKIYMAVVLLPLGAMLWQSTVGQKRPGTLGAKHPSGRGAANGAGRLALGLGAGLLACMPAALWYAHAYRTAAPDRPSAAHVYYSVRDSAEAHRFPQPLLRSPDFYRRVLDDLSGVVLTPLGLGLLLAGFLDRSWRRYLPWLLAAGVLIVLLPRKFHEMNYYWLAVLPPLCILVGLGWQVIAERLQLSRLATTAVLLVALVFTARFALHPLLTIPEEDRAVVAAGLAVQHCTAAEEPVVTMHGTTIDLLYYCRRPGWAISPDEPGVEKTLANCAACGARHLVVAGAKGSATLARPWPGWVPIERGRGFSVYARK